jgi:hypothetical protein
MHQLYSNPDIKYPFVQWALRMEMHQPAGSAWGSKSEDAPTAASGVRRPSGNGALCIMLTGVLGHGPRKIYEHTDIEPLVGNTTIAPSSQAQVCDPVSAWILRAYFHKWVVVSPFSEPSAGGF